MAKKNKSKNKSQGQLASSLNKLASALTVPKKQQNKLRVGSVKLAPPGKYLQALRDPFSDASAGVKVPDYDGNPSFTLASKDVLQISTDATGYQGGVLQFGTPPRMHVAAATTTGGTITLTGGAVTPWTDYSSGLLSSTNAVAARQVAAGFRITNLMSLAGNTPASGRLIIAPLSNTQVYNTGSFTESKLRKLPGCLVVPLTALAACCQPVYGHSAPLDPSALCYYQTNSNLIGVGNDDPQVLSFFYMIVGAPASTSCLEIEAVAHWEVLPVLANAVLTTAGVESSMSTMEKAFNWAQSHNPITWEMLNAVYEMYAPGYANGHPSRATLQN